MFDLVIQKFADWGGNEIFMLREDLLPIACGGNKVRIALKLLEDAQRKGADTIVGYGNSRSNLCRVLAMLCAAKRLKCVIVSPSDDDGTRIETTNSRLVSLAGAEIVRCEKGNQISYVIQNALDSIIAAGGTPYYIFGDKSGQGNEYVLQSAYEEVAVGILNWSKCHDINFDRIALAVGTGSTYGGLVNGFRAKGSDIKITGYTIARDVSRCEQGVRLFTKYGVDISDVALNGGYGKTSPRQLLFLQQQVADKMVLLDSTYAGKALWGLYQQCAQREIANERILFVHTGSLPLAIDSLSDSIHVTGLRDVSMFPLAQYEGLVKQMPKFLLRGEELLKYISKMVRLGNVNVLTSGDNLLGMIGFYANNHETKTAYLSMLVVDSSLQGSGASNILFSLLQTAARKSGMCRLEVNVISKNERAIRYYQKHGLQKAGGGQDADHVLMAGRL